jgi:hypothetical protein
LCALCFLKLMVEGINFGSREESQMSSPQGKGDLREQQLGCYRLWVRPKATDKKNKKRSHASILGHYLVGAKR